MATRQWHDLPLVFFLIKKSTEFILVTQRWKSFSQGKRVAGQRAQAN
jgi:hypothetical protein